MYQVAFPLRKVFSHLFRTLLDAGEDICRVIVQQRPPLPKGCEARAHPSGSEGQRVVREVESGYFRAPDQVQSDFVE